VSLNLEGVSQESMEKICTLLVEIEKRVSELSVEAGSRLEEVQRIKIPPRQVDMIQSWHLLWFALGHKTKAS
jgi:hypothetical protein